ALREIITLADQAPGITDTELRAPSALARRRRGAGVPVTTADNPYRRALERLLHLAQQRGSPSLPLASRGRGGVSEWARDGQTWCSWVGPGTATRSGPAGGTCSPVSPCSLIGSAAPRSACYTPLSTSGRTSEDSGAAVGVSAPQCSRWPGRLQCSLSRGYGG